MALNWQAPLGTNFDDTFYAYLKIMEGDTLAPVPVNGNPTIGVGFDLVAGGPVVQNAVLTGLGLTPSIVALSPNQAAALVAGTWQASEYAYVQQLRAQMVKNGSIGTMDSIMSQRAQDPNLSNIANRRTSFAFANDTEVRNVYNLLLPTYVNKIFTQYPALQTYTAFATSRERMVLTDLAWNGGTGILGSGLGNAIASGNRAEAWFQIRYASNGGNSRGLAKRRYQEAELFDLYDSPSNPSGPAEAQSVYDMFTKHRDAILAYEAKFGENSDGSLGIYGDMIAQANLDYPLSIGPAVQSLRQELQPAAQELSVLYGQGQTFDPLNIFDASSGKNIISRASDINSDLMIGGAVTDTLTGGTAAGSVVSASNSGNVYVYQAPTNGTITTMTIDDSRDKNSGSIGSVALTFFWVFTILYVVIYFKNTLPIVSVI